MSDFPAGSGDKFFKGLAEQKLQSFSIGTMGKRTLSRKEQEDLKRKQEQEDVGKVYQDFVSTFEDNNTSKVSKTWVKAGTFNAGNRKEDTSGRGQLYQPTAKFGLKEEDKKAPKPVTDAKLKRPEKPGKKKQQDKKKSNLEIFKEELKAMQEEREERHRIKSIVRGEGSGSSRSGSLGGGGGGGGGGSGGGVSGSLSGSLKSEINSTLYSDKDPGSHDNGDPNTTNLYLGNLSPRLTEQQLMELFGRYGPLASIKIMWPRTDDEKSRGRNCGFVAYMNRLDGERALENLCGKDIDGFEMRMGWGKPVPIPLQPIYVPPSLLKYTLPPDPTGLPFNCQPTKRDREEWNIGRGSVPPPPSNDEEREQFDRLLARSTVKVVIPTERTMLCLINRMVEFVIREGPMFEAMIMNRELNNRNFSFLFENQSPEHIYYRWRLFSLLQGDSKDKWEDKEFRMFKGGSIWKPPPVNLFTAGMPEHLIDDSEDPDYVGERKGISGKKENIDERPKEKKPTRNGLSNSQRDRFEDMLRNLYPDRNPIAEAMVWCLEHADAGEEIVECIAEALSILETPLAKKIARLYLISDILHNCSVKGVPNVSFYRKGFQSRLPDIFKDLRNCHEAVEARMKAEAFKQRVMNCFRAWEDWALYPQDFLIKLQNIFLGLVGDNEASVSLPGINNEEDDVDGKSLSEEDEDVDGIPLDGAALLKRGVSQKQQRNSDDSDVDGTPIRFDKNSTPPLSRKMESSGAGAPGFVPSKWETIDPEEVQAQAVTSKWDIFDPQPEAEPQRKTKGIMDPDDDDDDDDDVDGIPMNDNDLLDVRLSEVRRARMREVEIKVMSYQDELESGKEKLKPGWTVSEQIDQYRKKLLKQANSSRITAPETPDASTRSSSRHGLRDSPDSEEDSRGRSSQRREKSRKSKKSRRSSSSSRSRSRSRDRSRNSGKSRRRRSSRSSSPEEKSSRRNRNKRSRSRSPSSSSKKHKKKRH